MWAEWGNYLAPRIIQMSRLCVDIVNNDLQPGIIVLVRNKYLRLRIASPQLLWFTRPSVTKDFKGNFTPPPKFPIQMQHRLLKLLKPAAVCAAKDPPRLTSFILSFLQGNQDLFFAGTSHGTFHVSPEGTLSIQGKYSKFPIKYFL